MKKIRDMLIPFDQHRGINFLVGVTVYNLNMDHKIKVQINKWVSQIFKYSHFFPHVSDS